MDSLAGGELSSYSTPNILHALALIHNPTTKNQIRRQASDYLDQLKSSQGALQHGLALGVDQSQQPLVRHFGLSLLEHVVKHQSHELSDVQNEELRRCIIDLGRSITAQDPLFVRNKVAELWVDLAKRSWALDWLDLDQLLCQSWEQSNIHKSFVLTVLENLSEDTFFRDDPTAILRGRDLNAALVEIFTSTSDYGGGIRVGETIHHMRCGDEGWLFRISSFLQGSFGHVGEDADAKTTTLKAIATLRSAFGWVMAPAIETAGCLLVTCNCLTRSDEDIIISALDALIALYSRQHLQDAEVQTLVYSLCQAESVGILRQVYSWSIVSVDDILTQRYTISKKLSELVSLLSDLVTRTAPPESSSMDITAFLNFMIAIAQHDSLIVSIPAVHSWERLFAMPSWRRSEAVSGCVSTLLDVVCPRLLQYDQLPEDTDEPAVIFVNEEIEIFPERQGFYLNYRRLCSSVVEWVCYVHLEHATDFVLSQVETALGRVRTEDAAFNPADYRRISPLGLRADTQFSITDAAFKGLDKYLSGSRAHATEETKEIGERVRERCKAWALRMLADHRFKDPSITQRQVKTAVEISARAFQSDTGFAVAVLEHILASFMPAKPEYPAYSDGVTELHSYNAMELRRLAQSHADYFASFYEQLSGKFGDLISTLNMDPRIQTDLKSILFLILQRASSTDPEQQRSRLWTFLEPISNAWNDPSLQEALSSFQNYTRSQNFDAVGPFLSSVNAGQLEEWTSTFTNENGRRVQQQMVEAYNQVPLREARILLSTSTERLEQDSPVHHMICDLWTPIMPQILRGVLQIASYNHQLHNPDSWPNVSPDLAPTIKRVLRDRYWQSGISEGSMNDFHSKVKQTKSTLEGFASSVRGRIRTNLEQCYSIIHTLGRLGERFYSIPQVPELIAEALISTTGPLSPHHFSVLLLMLPKLIEECPPALRQHFLTPILSMLLQQIDHKLVTEWQTMEVRKQTMQEGESLSDEMRDESVLRQTTYKAVNMVSLWLSPRREFELTAKKSIVNGAHLMNGNKSQTMSEFVLSNHRVLEPLLVFTTHALTFKDTKATQTMIVTAQRIIPAFVNEQYLQGEGAASVREYISTEILKAAITALNDSHFADYQQHYAHLIANIWLAYGLPAHVPATDNHPAHDRPSLTETPRNVLLSLPNMDVAKVDAAAEKLLKEGINGKPKRLRAIVLHLLEGVRGVRISDLGKIDTRAQQSRILEKYKQRESLAMQGIDGRAETEGPDLGGVADMFGET
ncbi:uncharacterized protein HMPREF1541_07756 [Cyphellophora europaea CBS 101466]|uniref:Uncharacterized protein n=1 Tax=Cyphellophora europaea (strain CBS 101466) TaxID=1220924 RepID=W2RNT2_CYPE1|nr:uncharacterized protein HMPREF1541_07756 [Cyphellophora europaea CBS 101466]ETN38132.1 hypothetical protein HMPREF1541_07756 [Cyphellophora europaea CBS 101466]